MRRIMRTVRSFLLTLLFLLTAEQCQAQTVSIAEDASLLEQRDCIRVCLGGSGFGLGHADIAVGMGCANTDACVCDEQMRPAASSYITSCVSSDFSTCTEDFYHTRALSVYDQYCGFTAPAAATALPTTGNHGPATVTIYTSAPTVTVFSSSTSRTGQLLSSIVDDPGYEPSPTSSASSASSSTGNAPDPSVSGSSAASPPNASSSGLSKSDTINIVVPILCVLLSVMAGATGYWIRKWRKEKKAKKQAAAAAAAMQNDTTQGNEVRSFFREGERLYNSSLDSSEFV